MSFQEGQNHNSSCITWVCLFLQMSSVLWRWAEGTKCCVGFCQKQVPGAIIFKGLGYLGGIQPAVLRSCLQWTDYLKNGSLSCLGSPCQSDWIFVVLSVGVLAMMELLQPVSPAVPWLCWGGLSSQSSVPAVLSLFALTDGIVPSGSLLLTRCSLRVSSSSVPRYSLCSRTEGMRAGSSGLEVSLCNCLF